MRLRERNAALEVELDTAQRVAPKAKHAPGRHARLDAVDRCHVTGTLGQGLGAELLDRCSLKVLTFGPDSRLRITRLPATDAQRVSGR